MNKKRKPFFILFLNRHEKAAMIVPNSIAPPLQGGERWAGLHSGARGAAIGSAAARLRLRWRPTPWSPLFEGGKVLGAFVEAVPKPRPPESPVPPHPEPSPGREPPTAPPPPYGDSNRADQGDRVDAGIAWGVLAGFLAASISIRGAAIAVIVASVASGIKSPGFLVDEMFNSRKLVHIIYRSISIADTGVGARPHISGTGNANPGRCPGLFCDGLSGRIADCAS